MIYVRSFIAGILIAGAKWFGTMGIGKGCLKFNSNPVSFLKVAIDF